LGQLNSVHTIWPTGVHGSAHTSEESVRLSANTSRLFRGTGFRSTPYRVRISYFPASVKHWTSCFEEPV